MSPEEASFLALEFERVLQGLDLPLKAVPDTSINETAVLYDADGFKITARLCVDKCWRIDAETLERLPAMRRLAGERRKALNTDLAQTSPSRWVTVTQTCCPSAACRLRLAEEPCR